MIYLDEEFAYGCPGLEAKQVLKRLLGRQVEPVKIIVNDGLVGPGYAQASKDGEIASQTVAELEGILLDPVSTGKAAAALLNYSEND